MVMAEAAKVIVYSTPWCAFCKTEKQYLDHLGVAFVDKDIENDTAAFDELAQKTDGRTSGVPVTDIDGELVFGFDRKKIDELLKAKGLVN
jgi:glutaredoxin-like YruB-family protein